eukprot:gnl/TRDRNA2_/TRDRNA2_166329_c1_seq3.p1 gnl/TRDRNA2_/TRDRNA2_166329_c1~~gnl/TRDRNA2_/TRDRNA2_166329_c1_seq3.p1  ORF type:complete len:418 (-),score=115.39 gnl/TRDRNA2_/TRDRNA2_166329_c1_seq3:135-1388(-)
MGQAVPCSSEQCNEALNRVGFDPSADTVTVKAGPCISEVHSKKAHACAGHEAAEAHRKKVEEEQTERIRKIQEEEELAEERRRLERAEKARQQAEIARLAAEVEAAEEEHRQHERERLAAEERFRLECQREEEHRRAEEERLQAEEKRLHALEVRTSKDMERLQLEDEKLKAERERLQSDEERGKAESESRKKAEEERRSALEERERLAEEKLRSEEKRLKEFEERLTIAEERLRRKEEQLRAQEAEMDNQSPAVPDAHKLWLAEQERKRTAEERARELASDLRRRSICKTHSQLNSWLRTGGRDGSVSPSWSHANSRESALTESGDNLEGAALTQSMPAGSFAADRHSFVRQRPAKIQTNVAQQRFSAVLIEKTPSRSGRSNLEGVSREERTSNSAKTQEPHVKRKCGQIHRRHST